MSDTQEYNAEEERQLRDSYRVADRVFKRLNHETGNPVVSLLGAGALGLLSYLGKRVGSNLDPLPEDIHERARQLAPEGLTPPPLDLVMVRCENCGKYLPQESETGG